MEIETKFDIGQEVYLVFNKIQKKPFKKAIYGIIYNSTKENKTSYVIDEYGTVAPEFWVFATKSEAEQALKRLEGKDEKI